MHSSSSLNGLLSFIPPESEGLVVCEVPQVLKAPVARSLQQGLEAQLGYDPVKIFDILMQDYLGLTRYHVQRVALFWLSPDTVAPPHTPVATPVPLPVPSGDVLANSVVAHGLEKETRETGLIIQLSGLKIDKVINPMREQSNIHAVTLPGGTGQGMLPAVTYYVDESFQVAFFIDHNYLFFAESTACLEKLLNRYRAVALATQAQRATLLAESKGVSLFLAPEFSSAINNMPVKLFLKPNCINRILRNLEKERAELSAAGATLPPSAGTVALVFTPLPEAPPAEVFNMLGIGFQLAGKGGLEVCFLYDERKERNTTLNTSNPGQMTLNQASLINSLGLNNYMSIQKVLTKPSYVFKNKSIQVRGNINQELIPQASRYFLDALLKFFPYQYYFEDAAQLKQETFVK